MKLRIKSKNEWFYPQVRFYGVWINIKDQEGASFAYRSIDRAVDILIKFEEILKEESKNVKNYKIIHKLLHYCSLHFLKRKKTLEW